MISSLGSTGLGSFASLASAYGGATKAKPSFWMRLGEAAAAFNDPKYLGERLQSERDAEERVRLERLKNLLATTGQMEIMRFAAQQDEATKEKERERISKYLSSLNLPSGTEAAYFVGPDEVTRASAAASRLPYIPSITQADIEEQLAKKEAAAAEAKTSKEKSKAELELLPTATKAQRSGYETTIAKNTLEKELLPQEYKVKGLNLQHDEAVIPVKGIFNYYNFISSIKDLLSPGRETARRLEDLKTEILLKILKGEVDPEKLPEPVKIILGLSVPAYPYGRYRSPMPEEGEEPIERLLEIYLEGRKQQKPVTSVK